MHCSNSFFQHLFCKLLGLENGELHSINGRKTPLLFHNGLGQRCNDVRPYGFASNVNLGLAGDDNKEVVNFRIGCYVSIRFDSSDSVPILNLASNSAVEKIRFR